MSLLAEEIVEEWLNRQGYFTIRGAKLGVHQIDLLAVKPRDKHRFDRRHIEVQVSFRPIGYITNLPKKKGRAAGYVKHRTEAELRGSVKEWVDKKYGLRGKQNLLQELFPGTWTRELVVHNVKHEEEILEIQSQGVTVHRLRDIVRQMLKKPALLQAAVSGDVFDLMTLVKGQLPRRR